ncbi:DUF4861 family protein [uncultured Muribaculum sp.]|uniref:DUF4861 family protein n=1 Tax=uncultured Muribaculum sp. TaxID=1918613 RepID=UPI0025DA2641|nr:DUF4861 family protein [uncultured Muribaculum sp.]
MTNTLRPIITVAAMQIAVAACGASLDVTVANPSSAPRSAVGVAIPVKDMFPGKSRHLASVNIEGHPIPWQLDDLDGDGMPDELAFTVDIPASSEVSATVTVGEGTDGSEFTPATWAGLRLRDTPKRYPHVDSVTFPGSDIPRHTYDAIYGHGVMLEGSHGGIRVYADNRQSVDLYGKSSPRLELAETAFYTDSAREAEGYGCDILWAGNSIGAGSFRAVATDGTLVAMDTIGSRTQRVVSSGPVRSIVEVITPGWKVGDSLYDMTQRYTLWAGRRDVAVDITGLCGAPEAAFATGVLKLTSANDYGNGFISSRGQAISTGENIPDKKHPEKTETLAVGVATRSSAVASVREDSLDYILILNPDISGRISYSIAFASAKENGAPVKLADWQRYMDLLSSEIETPCTVSISVKAPADTITIFTIGDSTMADKDLRNENQERGWGQMLPLLVDGPVKVDNHAVNGRSSKSFIDEGRWDKVINKMKAGDYLVIQFGHNDEKAYNPSLYTVPGSTFDENLRRYVRETLAKGATPILMNSIVRRNFPAPGDSTVVVPDSLKKGYHPEAYAREGMLLSDTHGAYLDPPRRVADEMGIPFIDMNAITHNAIQALGRDASREYFMWILPDRYKFCQEGKIDNTHLNVKGATFIATLAAQALADRIPLLRPYITVARKK